MKENSVFAEENKSLPEHVVLKLAVDSENLGLWDSQIKVKLNFDFLTKSDGAIIHFVFSSDVVSIVLSESSCFGMCTALRQ